MDPSLSSSTAPDFTLAHAHEQLTVSPAVLRNVVAFFRSEMVAGLLKERSSLRMLRSYVGKATGLEEGSYLALDLGGTNFRVFLVSIKEGKIIENQHMSFTVHQDAMKGVASDLFDFLASSVAQFIEKAGSKETTYKLGFTFSFPVQQHSINRGTLLAWTKGFDVEGVVGRDVVELLMEAFTRQGLKIDVSALANDTVGTMVACTYADTECNVGLILGTGTNACYFEDFSEVPEDRKETPTIINMEWGAFDNIEKRALPLTECDHFLDSHSLHPGTQTFEKMISGMYLGEIARLFLRKLIASKALFNGTSPHILNVPYMFETEFMSRIAGDSSENLDKVGKLIEEVLQVHGGGSLEDRKAFLEVCHLVSLRAARLTTAGLVAILEHMKIVGNKTTIAVDGSVFEKYPGFQQQMKDTFVELIGEESSSKLNLTLSKDGSSVGAAIIAAVAVGK